jgi:uncharacterized membrane protein YtjA (UPF0391 family)
VIRIWKCHEKAIARARAVAGPGGLQDPAAAVAAAAAGVAGAAWPASSMIGDRQAIDTQPPTNPNWKGNIMLSWTLAFLVVALIAAFFGFAGIAGTAAWIAQVLFVLFLVLFLVSLIFGRKRV